MLVSFAQQVSEEDSVCRYPALSIVMTTQNLEASERQIPKLPLQTCLMYVCTYMYYVWLEFNCTSTQALIVSHNLAPHVPNGKFDYCG